MTYEYPLQRIRRAYESVIENALTTLTDPSIPVYTDNAYYADKKGSDEFALVRLSFGAINDMVVGGMMEDIRGSLIVEIYVPKGKGPGRAQSASEAVLFALTRMNTILPAGDGEVVARVGPVSGPNLSPLRAAPHFQARLSCSIRAAYTGL